MASLKELTATFSAAVGPRRYILPSLVLAIGTLLNFAVLKLGNGPIDPSGPFTFLPFVAGVVVAAAMISWWLLNYAARLRGELRGATDLEHALDVLSTYFDEGTSRILNALVASDVDYGEWGVRRRAWHEKVERHLETNFGLRERNVFRNLVLVQPVIIPGSHNDQHNFQRCMVAQQLEKIRETIIRYSDLAAKRRAETQ